MHFIVSGDMEEARRRAYLAHKLMVQTEMCNVHDLDIIQNGLKLDDGTRVHVLKQHGLKTARIYVPPKEIAAGEEEESTTDICCPYCENFTDGTYDIYYSNLIRGIHTLHDVQTVTFAERDEFDSADKQFYIDVQARGGYVRNLDNRGDGFMSEHTNATLYFSIDDLSMYEDGTYGTEGYFYVHISTPNGDDPWHETYFVFWFGGRMPVGWMDAPTYPGFTSFNLADIAPEADGSYKIDLSEQIYTDALLGKIGSVSYAAYLANVKINMIKICANPGEELIYPQDFPE